MENPKFPRFIPTIDQRQILLEAFQSKRVFSLQSIQELFNIKHSQKLSRNQVICLVEDVRKKLFVLSDSVDSPGPTDVVGSSDSSDLDNSPGSVYSSGSTDVVNRSDSTDSVVSSDSTDSVASSDSTNIVTSPGSVVLKKSRNDFRYQKMIKQIIHSLTGDEHSPTKAIWCKLPFRPQWKKILRQVIAYQSPTKAI